MFGVHQLEIWTNFKFVLSMDGRLYFLMFAGILLVEPRLSLPPASACHPSCVRTSNSPRVCFPLPPKAFHRNMESSDHGGNGKPARIWLFWIRNELWGFVSEWLRPISNMAQPASTWRCGCATLHRRGAYVSASLKTWSFILTMNCKRAAVLLSESYSFISACVGFI